MICVPLTCATAAAARDAMQAAKEVGDLIELRIDCLEDITELQSLIQESPLPLIATYRRSEDGGRSDIPEAMRMEILHNCAKWGADYVDIEIDFIDTFHPEGDGKVIVSFHDFDGVTENIESLVATMAAHERADIVKVAVMANSLADNIRVLKLPSTINKPMIALCMGEKGIVSRIAGKKFGSYLTFASLGQGQESALGQITAADLKKRFIYDRINDQTRLVGIIANPVEHSMSPDIHNAAFEATAINALYLPFKVEEDPVDFIKAFDAWDLAGYSVTIPHKEAVQPALNEIEPLANAIGALNTIVKDAQGDFQGYNTDCSASINALEAVTPLAKKHVLLLGAGGAAKALAYGLLEKGANLTIANRTLARATELAERLDANAVALEDVGNGHQDGHWDIIVNTTSVGMWPHVDDSPYPADALQKEMVVFDTIYNPIQTKLLGEAEAAGCRTLNGIDMFIGQAAQQFEYWMKTPAPTDVMREVMVAKLTEAT